MPLSTAAEGRKKRLEGLIRRIEDYEAFFDESEKAAADDESQNEMTADKKIAAPKRLDHQATTAYMNLVKLACSLMEALGSEGHEPGQISQAARRIFMEEYGVELG